MKWYPTDQSHVLDVPAQHTHWFVAKHVYEVRDGEPFYTYRSSGFEDSSFISRPHNPIFMGLIEWLDCVVSYLMMCVRLHQYRESMWAMSRVKFSPQTFTSHCRRDSLQILLCEGKVGSKLKLSVAVRKKTTKYFYMSSAVFCFKKQNKDWAWNRWTFVGGRCCRIFEQSVRRNEFKIMFRRHLSYFFTSIHPSPNSHCCVQEPVQVCVQHQYFV